jgi:hypothetical protein
MSVILFILGIVLAAAGIVAIGFGIPINEFNLGNTMIVAGTVAVSAGLILFGLAAAVDQLTQIANALPRADALRPRAGARPVPQPAQATEPPMPETVHPVPPTAPVPGKPAMPAPPRNPVFARKLEERAEPAPAAAEAEPEVSFSAIERLRSSLGRPDRNAGDSADAEDIPYAPAAPVQAAPPGPAPARVRGANGAAPPAGAESQKKPALDFLFRSKREPQPEAFDSVWPQRGGQRRSEEQREESGRPAAEAPIDRAFPAVTPAAAQETRPPAILKSGVVDGMAYTLYADGSIEAQLPQGTVRFGSIAELRTHIENNS